MVQKIGYKCAAAALCSLDLKLVTVACVKLAHAAPVLLVESHGSLVRAIIAGALLAPQALAISCFVAIRMPLIQNAIRSIDHKSSAATFPAAMQATPPPRSDGRVSPKREVRTSPLEQHEDVRVSARGGASAAAPFAASGKPKSIEYLLVSRFNHMFAVTQELLLMFPREKAGAHRLVCDLQSEIDSLFQSIRANQSNLEEAAKLRDLQLQHASLGSSLAQSIAEKIALEQLLQKEREAADAAEVKHRNAIAETEANVQQNIAHERRVERDAAASERARLLEKLSAMAESLAAAKQAQAACESNLSESREETVHLREKNEQLKQSHAAEYAALRQEADDSQRAVLASPEIEDRQRAAAAIEHHQEVASLMSARAGHMLHCNRKGMLLRRARRMFRHTFSQWLSSCKRANLIRKVILSRAQRRHFHTLRSAFLTWFLRANYPKRPAVSSSSLSVARGHVSTISSLGDAMKSWATQAESFTASISVRVLSETITQLHGLCQLTEQALRRDSVDGRRPMVVLPEVEVDRAAAAVSDADEEGDTLQHLTFLLNDMTTQLMTSQNDCEQLRLDALQHSVDNDVVQSQMNVLQQQFQVSIAAITDKVNRAQQLVARTSESMLKCIEGVTSTFSVQKAAAAAVAALDSFVAAYVHDSSTEVFKKLKDALGTVKLALQNDPHAAELARAVEENRFITQRLQALTQTLDGEFELVNRNAAEATAIQCVSLIERAFAMLKQRGERAQEGVAATAAECKRLHALANEKSEALVSSLQISSMLSSKQQQIEDLQQVVVNPYKRISRGFRRRPTGCKARTQSCKRTRRASWSLSNISRGASRS